MRILVTGAAGFIGSAVVRVLAAAGDTVLAVVRPGHDAPRLAGVPGGVTRLGFDLADPAAVDAALARHRPDAAIHLAWHTLPGHYWTAPENLDSASWSLGLARALVRHGCERLVGAGTGAEYDWSHERLIERRTPCRPRTLYAIAKHGVFLMIEEFARQSSLSFAWARYHFLYGPRERPERLVPTVIAGLRRGDDVPCTAGTQVRDFMHVDDAAAATVALLKSKASGAVNVATGAPVPVRALVAELVTLVGGPGRVVFGARALAPDEPAALRPDVSRLTALGFTPRYSLGAGLRDTVSRWTACPRPPAPRA